jgi:hypothetical protein
VIQIELVGTCDKRYRDRYGGVYWPEAPRWLLDELAKLMRWIERTHGVKRESTKRPWVPYPKSYANGGGQRMTNAEWDSFGGWCGHQHAPENTHGDPGDIDITYLLRGATPTPTPPQSEEDDMPLTDQDVARIATAVHNMRLGRSDLTAGQSLERAGSLLPTLNARVAALETATQQLASGQGLDPEELAEAVEKAVREGFRRVGTEPAGYVSGV